jgi:serine/threonine-protein kinase
MAVPRPDSEEVVVDPVQLGRYVLLDPIAQGRTGQVHRACLRHDGAQDELLAIKLVSHELLRDRRAAENFVEVIGRAAQLEHPEHCAILDFDLTPDGALYVAMELVAGKDLGRVASQLDEIGRAMPPQLVAYIGAQVAGALDAAHAMQAAGAPAPLHHGELAPSDILIGYDGRVRVTGLGTAELGLASPRASYRAPELARGGACTAQSDVFSLAACLYEVLAGRPAFSAEHGSGAHGRRRPESHITKVIPRPLERILTRALAEQPEARWPSAADFGRALASWSAAQSGRSDANALAMFMISIFDAAIAEEDARLRAWLARAGSAQPRPKAAPSAPSVPDRNSYARLVRASARPSPEAALTEWNDPAEHTPARGLLMRKLAADMIAKLGAAGEPAQSRSVPTHPTAGLGFADLLSDESWDEEKPVVGWISESEERENSVPPPMNTAPASAPTAAVPPKLPPRSLGGSVRPAPKARSQASVPAIPIAPHEPEPTPVPARTPVHAAPRASARPLAPASALAPAFAPAFAPEPVFATTTRRQRSAWLVPALVAGTLALALAAVFALRSGGADRSTLHVRTRPSGAEVFLRGERLGTTPLTREGLASGDAALELHAPGFETASRTIQLQPGKAAHFDVDLIRRAIPAAPNAATREADLQAQLAARAAPQSAEPAAAAEDDGPAGDREDRPRRRSGAESRDPEADAQEAAATAAAPEASVTRNEAVLELKPAPEPEPQLIPAAPTPAVAKPAAAAAAPTKPAPSARVARGPSRAPVLVQQTMPRFPARARRMGVAQGVVTLEFTINAAGRVTDALVLKADPPGLFDEAAMRAIEKWRYEPKLEGGTPVAMRQRYTFRFLEE